MSMRNVIPEELATDILWRLPVDPCITRFRCVCKSWRDLLSDSFILQKLSGDGGGGGRRDTAAASSDHQIMIKSDFYSYIPLVSILHFPDETIEPLLPDNKLPLPANNSNSNNNNYHDYVDQSFAVEECCNGVFCLSHRDSLGTMHFTLWNPATSEIKVVPLSPFHHKYRWGLGFGFDSKTNDYKIVRQVWNTILIGETAVRRDFYEVYSLRKDSWSKLEDDDDVYYPERLPGERISQLCNGKLYWSQMPEELDTLLFESFDLSSEAFRRVQVPYPSTSRNLSASGKCLLNEEFMVAVFEVHNDDVKRDPHEMQITKIDPAEIQETVWEIWALLKYWVPESWTKLFDFTTPLANFIGFSRNLKFFFVLDANDDCLVLDFQTGEISQFEIRGENIITYVPSQIPLRSYSIEADGQSKIDGKKI